MPAQSNEHQLEEAPSRFVVGVDLGTTNCAVMYVDTERSDWQVKVFRVSQLVAPGEVEARETLPSFYYQAGSTEMAAGALRLPWNQKENAPGRWNAGTGSWQTGAHPADCLRQIMALS